MEGFYLKDSLRDLPTSISEHAFAASSSIETAEGGRCSGTFISEDGIYLTALHCLGASLQSHGLIHEPKLLDGQLKIMNVLEQNPKSAFAKGFYLGDYPNIRDPQIVFLGKGVHYFSSDLVRRMDNKELQRAIHLYEDIALLKFDVSGIQIVPAKLATTSPNIETSIWHISKPYSAARNHDAANGNTKYITTGEIVNPFEMNVFDKIRKNCCDDCELSKLIQYYSGGRFFSSLDFNNGSSGGGVFNSIGELVGMNVISLHDPTKNFMPGGCGSHSAEAIYKSLESYKDRKSLFI